MFSTQWIHDMLDPPGAVVAVERVAPPPPTQTDTAILTCFMSAVVALGLAMFASLIRWLVLGLGGYGSVIASMQPSWNILVLDVFALVLGPSVPLFGIGISLMVAAATAHRYPRFSEAMMVASGVSILVGGFMAPLGGFWMVLMAIVAAAFPIVSAALVYFDLDRE
ncbi:MAG: hypothetical protein AB7P40_14800 [Chloroflexota bacterium]